MGLPALKRVPVEIRPPLTLQDLSWRAAANSNVELVEGFAQKFLRVGGKVLGHAFFYVQFLELEGDTPRRTPIMDRPPAGQTLPNWLDEIKESGKIAAEIITLQQQIRLMEEYGLGNLTHSLKQELDQIAERYHPALSTALSIKASVTNSAAVNNPAASATDLPEENGRPVDRLLRTSGRIFVLPLSQRQLKQAQGYWAQPVTHPETPKREPWEAAGDEALEVLTDFDTSRQNYRLSFEQLQRYLNSAVFQDGRVLQIGFSLGYPLRVLGDHFTGDWIGVDYDPVVVARARELNPKATIMESSAYFLPFTDNSFDVVYSHSFLDVLDNPERALQEALRVLRPGGLLLHLMDCIPNRHQLGNMLTIRGLGTTSKAYHPSILTGRGSDEIRVIPVGNFGGDEYDLLKQVHEAERKVPLTTLSMLSMAHLLGVFEQVTGLSYIEAGFLVSLSPYSASPGPELKVSNSTKLLRAWGPDSPSLSWDRLRLSFEALKINLRSLFSPTKSLEIYVTDYLVAQKKQNVTRF